MKATFEGFESSTVIFLLVEGIFVAKVGNVLPKGSIFTFTNQIGRSGCGSGVLPYSCRRQYEVAEHLFPIDRFPVLTVIRFLIFRATNLLLDREMGGLQRRAKISDS
ncbi:unnamed protein product [Prunus brigantina]